jgi:hypothetical protein
MRRQGDRRKIHSRALAGHMIFLAVGSVELGLRHLNSGEVESIKGSIIPTTSGRGRHSVCSLGG